MPVCAMFGAPSFRSFPLDVVKMQGHTGIKGSNFLLPLIFIDLIPTSIIQQINSGCKTAIAKIQFNE